MHACMCTGCWWVSHSSFVWTTSNRNAKIIKTMHRLSVSMESIFVHLWLYRVCVFLHVCRAFNHKKNNTDTKRKLPFGVVVVVDVLLTLYLYGEGGNSRWVQRWVLLVFSVHQTVTGNHTVGLLWWTPFQISRVCTCQRAHYEGVFESTHRSTQP